MWDHLSAKHKDAFKAAKSSQEEFVAKKKKETGYEKGIVEEPY